MKINIEKISNEIVCFSTIYGKAKGIWKGGSDPEKKEYYVELDIDKLYSYDELIISKSGKYQIEISNEKIHLTLLLLEYEKDGCATFQFGNSIIEIETTFDERFYALINTYVTIYVEKLNIYDENL